MSAVDVLMKKRQEWAEKEAPKRYFEELAKKNKAILKTMELLDQMPEQNADVPFYSGSIKCAFEDILGETYSEAEARELCNTVRQILTNRLEHLQVDFVEAFKQ